MNGGKLANKRRRLNANNRKPSLNHRVGRSACKLCHPIGRK